MVEESSSAKIVLISKSDKKIVIKRKVPQNEPIIQSANSVEPESASANHEWPITVTEYPFVDQKTSVSESKEETPTVGKKLSSLERLKSLNFTAPKVDVNIFASGPSKKAKLHSKPSQTLQQKQKPPPVLPRQRAPSPSLDHFQRNDNFPPQRFHANPEAERFSQHRSPPRQRISENHSERFTEHRRSLSGQRDFRDSNFRAGIESKSAGVENRQPFKQNNYDRRNVNEEDDFIRNRPVFIGRHDFPNRNFPHQHENRDFSRKYPSGREEFDTEATRHHENEQSAAIAASEQRDSLSPGDNLDEYMRNRRSAFSGPLDFEDAPEKRQPRDFGRRRDFDSATSPRGAGGDAEQRQHQRFNQRSPPKRPPFLQDRYFRPPVPQAPEHVLPLQLDHEQITHHYVAPPVLLDRLDEEKLQTLSFDLDDLKKLSLRGLRNTIEFLCETSRDLTYESTRLAYQIKHAEDALTYCPKRELDEEVLDRELEEALQLDKQQKEAQLAENEQQPKKASELSFQSTICEESFVKALCQSIYDQADMRKEAYDQRYPAPVINDPALKNKDPDQIKYMLSMRSFFGGLASGMIEKTKEE